MLIQQPFLHWVYAVFILLYVKSVLWLNLAPVVQKVNNSDDYPLDKSLSAGQKFIHSAIQGLNNLGHDYNIILNLVWFRISFLFQPILIIQMYSVQETMKFWFIVRTDFTHNIFKCWFTCILTQIKNIMQLLRFRRRKTRLDQSQ